MIDTFLRRFTVRQRVIGGFLILALLLALVPLPLMIVNNYFLVGHLLQVSEVEARADRLLLLAATDIASSRMNLMRYANDYVSSPDEAVEDIDSAADLLAQARDLVSSSEQKDAVTAVWELLSDYKILIGDVQTARTADGQDVSQPLSEAYQLGSDMQEQIERIVQESEVRVEEANRQVRAESQVRLIILIVAYGLLLVLALISSRLIERSITRPVEELRAGAEAFRQGLLEAEIPVVGADELTLLGQTFNQIAADLRASQAQQEAWSHELEERVTERTEELRQAFEEQQLLLRTIREMSVPVIPVMEGILVTPIVGTLDSERAQRVMGEILAGIEAQRARVIILDITALAVMDTAVANTLLQAARAAQLLGTQAILVGIAPEVAETLVQLGIDLKDLHTAATLQEGLHLGLSLLRRRVVTA